MYGRRMLAVVLVEKECCWVRLLRIKIEGIDGIDSPILAFRNMAAALIIIISRCGCSHLQCPSAELRLRHRSRETGFSEVTAVDHGNSPTPSISSLLRQHASTLRNLTASIDMLSNDPRKQQGSGSKVEAKAKDTKG